MRRHAEANVSQSDLDRRTLLKLGGLATAGAIVGPSCAARVIQSPTLQGPRRLAKANVSWERLVRTMVGLRPGRRGGFRLEAERIDGKTVVHNYGHNSEVPLTLRWKKQ